MATFQSGASRGYYITLELTPKAYNIASNTTPVEYVFKLHSGGYNFSAHTSLGKLEINGTSLLNTNQQYTIGKNTSITLASGTTTIVHNSDGKKTISFKASFDVVSKASYTPASILSVSNTLVLPTIPRASSFSLGGSTQTGSEVTVSITRASSSFTHTVRYRVGTGAWVTVGTGIATSTSFTVPHTSIPNATSAVIEVSVQTFSGSTKIGGEVKNKRTLTVPASIVPKFTTVTVSENVSEVATKVGAYVQGKSRLNLEITGADGSNGSTIKSYSITLPGTTINAVSGVSNVVNTSGSVVIEGTVTDSRGRSATKEITITVLAYSPPKITNVSVVRSLSNGTQSPTGEYSSVKFTGSVSSLKVETTEKNIYKGVVKSKRRQDSTYTQKVNETYTGISGAKTYTHTGYSIDFGYDFIIEVHDIFGYVSSVAIIPVGLVTMQWGADFVSIGMMVPGTDYNAYIGYNGLKSYGKITDKRNREVFGFGGTIVKRII